MKHVLEVCLVALAVTCLTGAQDPTKPVLKPGVRVEMPVASHAVEMRAADELDATVVSVTADGKLFLGTQSVELNTLNRLKQGTVYVKADARAQYQKILMVLDALHGRPVVLLTSPTPNAPKSTIMPPYGVKVVMGGR